MQRGIRFRDELKGGQQLDNALVPSHTAHKDDDQRIRGKAKFVARLSRGVPSPGWQRKPAQVHPADGPLPHHGDLIGGDQTFGNQKIALGRTVGITVRGQLSDNSITLPRNEALETRQLDPRLAGEGMQSNRHPGQPRGQGGEQTGLRGRGVDDVKMPPEEQFQKLEQRAKIGQRRRLAGDRNGLALGAHIAQHLIELVSRTGDQSQFDFVRDDAPQLLGQQNLEGLRHGHDATQLDAPIFALSSNSHDNSTHSAGS